MRRIMRLVILFGVPCALCFGLGGACFAADETDVAEGGIAFSPAVGLFTQVRNPLNPQSVYPHKIHREIAPSELKADGYDPTRLKGIIAEIDRCYTSENTDPAAAVKLRSALKRLREEIDIFTTRLTLMDTQYDRDVHDKKLSRDIVRLNTAYTDLTNQAMDCMARVLDGPFHDILADELTASEEKTLRQHSSVPELIPLEKKESRLRQEYDRIISEKESLEQTAAKALPVFQELVAVRTEIAKVCGFDNYADYADSFLYGRDYTGADLENLYAAVRQHLVPVYVEWSNDFVDAELAEDHRADGDRILEEIAPFIGQIDPGLKEAFNYLRRNRVSDLDDYPGKQDVGYTNTMPQYGSAYIFNAPAGDERDYTNTVHEFGHFNSTYHDPTPVLFSSNYMDTQELQSQGLEMLFMEYYDRLFGQDAALLQEDALLGMLDSVIQGCMSDEFQRTVYTHPDMSGEEINALAARLCAEYGQIDAGLLTPEEAALDWTLLDHTFSSPLYYISYATSGLSAIDLYLKSLEDRQAAVDTYMKVSAMGGQTAYRRAISSCGLRDIFAPDTVPAIAARLAEIRAEQQPAEQTNEQAAD